MESAELCTLTLGVNVASSPYHTPLSLSLSLSSVLFLWPKEAQSVEWSPPKGAGTPSIHRED